MTDNKKDRADPRNTQSKDDETKSGADSNTDEDSVQLKPVRPKIGESEDNLKQRSDWFQKRSGKQ